MMPGGCSTFWLRLAGIINGIPALTFLGAADLDPSALLFFYGFLLFIFGMKFGMLTNYGEFQV